jgi:hypothetical protein
VPEPEAARRAGGTDEVGRDEAIQRDERILAEPGGARGELGIEGIAGHRRAVQQRA